jgi:hypothetical protein
MITIIEGDKVIQANSWEELMPMFKKEEWLNEEDMRTKLREKGHEFSKYVQYRKSFCKRHGIQFKKIGQEFFYSSNIDNVPNK